ncbi:AAA family ATPase [Candidatus Woesearchaeota archaeon]|nr:AAA family ATPase [Candidatus Woesearchaeota archaeon]
MGGLFDNILGGNESLFLNPEHLDYGYRPKLIPFRENQQFYIANCIKPLFNRRDGKNLLIYGAQGIGKTVCCKHVLNELQDQTDDILVIYINCWIDETSYKITLDICNQIGYKWIADKNTKDLIDEITNIINKKSAVIIFDEFDKMQDYSILYALLEKIYRKCILMVTNDAGSVRRIEPRIMSRLNLDKLEFKPYNPDEVKEILRMRKDYAFVKNVFENDAFELIAKKTFELKDIRKGLFLLEESGNIAEEESSRKILLKHAEIATKKIDDFDDEKILEGEEKKVLRLLKENPEKNLKDIYELYKAGENKSFRTFQRIVSKLRAAKAVK